MKTTMTMLAVRTRTMAIEIAVNTLGNSNIRYKDVSGRCECGETKAIMAYKMHPVEPIVLQMARVCYCEGCGDDLNSLDDVTEII